MQQDPALAGLLREVRIVGVNGVGRESGNAVFCAGRTIPWLQDVALVDAWGLWGVAYRDVVILDAQNRPIAIYNLTAHDLQVQANRDELLGILVAAASAP